MIGEEVRSEVGNKGIQGICTKELDSMLPLRRTDKTWVRNDLETRRGIRILNRGTDRCYTGRGVW
jgi:hypothetical protein